MEAVFVRIFNMGISAGVLILVVLLLRLLLRRAPKWIICLLWALVAIRLVCPFGLTSPFSAYRMIAPQVSSGGEMQYIRYNGRSEKPLAVIDRNDYAFLESGVDESGNRRHDPDIYLPPFVLIWEFGVCLLLLYAVYEAYRLKRPLREAVRYRDLHSEGQKDAAGGAEIWLCDAVKSPFVFGVIHPKIYLSSSLCEEQMEYVLAHEQAHIARRDHWWKPIGYLLLCVYWFHPLCWVAYCLFCRDIETACDEKVIGRRDLPWKKAYSEALLSCSMQRETLLFSPLTFGEVSVKERVKSVLGYKKPAFWLLAVSLVVCAVAAVCFLTNPKSANTENGQENVAQGEQKGDTAEHMTEDVTENAAEHMTEGVTENAPDDRQSGGTTAQETEAGAASAEPTPETEHYFEKTDEVSAFFASITEDPKAYFDRGCMVLTYRTVYGADMMEGFYRKYLSGEKTALPIVLYTVEGDPFLVYLKYDGRSIKIVNDSSKDKFAGSMPKVWENYYPYFYIFEETIDDETYRNAYLSELPDLTAEKVRQIRLRSDESSLREAYYVAGYREEGDSADHTESSGDTGG